MVLLNFRNVYIHLVCVPMIWWSLMIFLGRLPILMISNYFAISIPYIASIGYLLYFALLDPIAAVIS